MSKTDVSKLEVVFFFSFFARFYVFVNINDISIEINISSKKTVNFDTRLSNLHFLHSKHDQATIFLYIPYAMGRYEITSSVTRR